MKQVKTFSEYMNDEERVSSAEREKINFEIELIGKIVEAREQEKPAIAPGCSFFT